MITVPIWLFWMLPVVCATCSYFVHVCTNNQNQAVHLMVESGKIRQIYFYALMHYAKQEDESAIVALKALEEGANV